jgi:hypothetical protein
MVMPRARGVHAEGADDRCHPAFPQTGPRARRNHPQSWLNNWAQIAIIPTNSVIDAKAAASSTKIRNITASFKQDH